jgi:hypothetical protein
MCASLVQQDCVREYTKPMRTHIDPDDGPIAQIAIDHAPELLQDDRAFDALAQDRLTS